MSNVLLDLAAVKAQIASLETQKTALQEQIIQTLQASSRKTMQARADDGRVVKGTLIAGERVIIDADALEKSLTKTQWKKVTRPVLDKELLEAAVAQKIVDQNVVAAASEIKSNAPYIRVSGDISVAPWAEKPKPVKRVVRKKVAR